jgi:hypothetical protein
MRPAGGALPAHVAPGREAETKSTRAGSVTLSSMVSPVNTADMVILLSAGAVSRHPLVMT